MLFFSLMTLFSGSFAGDYTNNCEHEFINYRITHLFRPVSDSREHMNSQFSVGVLPQGFHDFKAAITKLMPVALPSEAHKNEPVESVCDKIFEALSILNNSKDDQGNVNQRNLALVVALLRPSEESEYIKSKTAPVGGGGGTCLTRY